MRQNYKEKTRGIDKNEKKKITKKNNPDIYEHAPHKSIDRRNRHDRQAEWHVFQPKTYLDVQTCSALIDSQNDADFDPNQSPTKAIYPDVQTCSAQVDR